MSQTIRLRRQDVPSERDVWFRPWDNDPNAWIARREEAERHPAPVPQRCQMLLDGTRIPIYEGMDD